MSKYPMSSRRRIAIASYRPPRDGIIYGSITLDCTDVLKYLDGLRETTGEHVTITAFMGAVIGRALEAEPTLNGRIHLGRYIPYDRVNIAFLVQMNEGDNLAQVLVEDIDKKTPAQVFADLKFKAARLRSHEDPNFEKSIKLTGKLPTPILRRVLSFGSFMTTGVGVPFVGQDAFPFGSAVITSVGMLGVDEAFIPPTPFLRVPLYVGIGAIRDMVFPVDGQPVVKPGISMSATLDHRFVDGYQAAGLIRVVRKYFEHPELLDGIVEVPASRPAGV
ncbi:MAG: 2-oxo acid dehydrogenase subunit E2 [Actinomycetes bacterium]